MADAPRRRTLPLRRWALIAMLALLLGAALAEPYMRVTIPAYRWLCATIAHARGWQMLELTVAQDPHGYGQVLRLRGVVTAQGPSGAYHSALIVSRVQIGAAVETCVVFWTLLCLWPTRSLPRRVLLLVLAVPVFCVLEAALTGTELLEPFAYANAVLEGAPISISADRASRFIEAGGRFALEVTAAVALASLFRPARPVH